MALILSKGLPSLLIIAQLTLMATFITADHITIATGGAPD